MNHNRRESIRNIIETIQVLNNQLEDLMAEEEEDRNRMPENLQGSAQYEKANEACEKLESAVEELENAIDDLEDAIE